MHALEASTGLRDVVLSVDLHWGLIFAATKTLSSWFWSSLVTNLTHTGLALRIQ